MRGTPEIQIKKKLKCKYRFNCIKRICNTFEEQKYENTLNSMTKVNIKDNKRPIGHVSHISKDSSNDKISFIES